MTEETLLAATPQETRPPKHPIIHIRGSCKKAKAHKQIPEYTITKDDVNLVTERVHDCATEECEEVKNQRGRIQNELVDIKQVLEQIQATQRKERGTESIPGAIETEDMSV
jgi:hypothetical protein